ncbi:hypothetical protein CHLRE_13g581150v5 [Chlamydomonas reinhardtii]|uniref:N-acetyltransferase domain-containing protein n=1 Tax=Chlamydomonas reinhardtii TaxID=3055 RepID=A0A2K3D0E2_CHLRE|nr:uncharacterized protein CHLRE_13g581150v5 [Chlamydomonas reinhardtii]PNW74000.1 hypothetical protein CHLRE_13g581150v5 [Chlamydomonas reinhardtii]
MEDTKEVALIFAESFGRGNFPGVQAEALDALETSYVGAIEREMTDKLRETMEAKVQASREHREYRMQQYLQLLRAQLAALRGEPARFPTQPSPSDERNLQRLRRARQFLVLVAEERPTAEAGEAGGQASASSSVAAEAAAEPEPEAAAPGPGPGSAACATGAAASAAAYGGARRRGQAVAAASLSLLQPEALLPPPFPSNKPYRLYVSNMSVVPAHRRRGLAKRLLLQCERVARLWGHESIWLHVKRSNAAAAALYASMGYTPVESGGMRLLPGPLSQVLMTKTLPPLRGSCRVELGRGGASRSQAAAGSSSSSGSSGNGGSSSSGAGGVSAGEAVVSGVSGRSREKDGVFVWGAVVEGAGDVGPTDKGAERPGQ